MSEGRRRLGRFCRAVGEVGVGVGFLLVCVWTVWRDETIVMLIAGVFGVSCLMLVIAVLCAEKRR